MSSVRNEPRSRTRSRARGAPVAVGPAEDAEVVQPGAAGVGDGVDLLELHGDQPGQPVVGAVADHAVALDHVGAVGQPAPGALEGAVHRVVVGVEDADELALGDAQRGVDVLRLRGAVRDADHVEVGVALGHQLQARLDLHRAGVL